jgi:hypothetical protein
MATLTNEQIEAKKQQPKQVGEQAKKLKDELVEAGAWPLEEDDLNAVAGGCYHPFLDFKDPTQPKR